MTGAASGIGLATVKLFLEEGARVVATDISKEIESLVQEMKSDGKSVSSVEGDVSIESDAMKMVETAVETFGKLDIVFNNAGYNFPASAHLIDKKDWDRLMSVNLTGTLLVSKYAVARMIEQKKGSIVNNASTHGLIGSPEDAAYSASKGGVISLTRQMAFDYAPFNIRVNCVCAGPTLTPRIQRSIDSSPDPNARRERSIRRVLLGRFATPREIAFGVLYLASDEASFVTGSSLVMDGGQTIR